MITKRFYITPNLGIPVIQRWQNNHWVFDRWPTDEEIKQEKVLKYDYDINKEFNNKNMPKGKCTESIIISDELEKYNIDKSIELDNRAKHVTWLNIRPTEPKRVDWSKITFTKIRDVRFPLITDSQVYTVDTHNHSHKYLLTQMEIDPVATQGEKGTDHTWVGSDYEGGYCPRRCCCPCCGRSY